MAVGVGVARAGVAVGSALTAGDRAETSVASSEPPQPAAAATAKVSPSAHAASSDRLVAGRRGLCIRAPEVVPITHLLPTAGELPCPPAVALVFHIRGRALGSFCPEIALDDAQRQI